MPTVEMTNGQQHVISEEDVSTTSGAIRRIEKAREESKFARFKDHEGDTVGVNPASVSSVY